MNAPTLPRLGLDDLVTVGDTEEGYVVVDVSDGVTALQSRHGTRLRAGGPPLFALPSPAGGVPRSRR